MQRPGIYHATTPHYRAKHRPYTLHTTHVSVHAHPLKSQAAHTRTRCTGSLPPPLLPHSPPLSSAYDTRHPRRPVVSTAVTAALHSQSSSLLSISQRDQPPRRGSEGTRRECRGS
eukprot:scaffold6339_cov112-Isochrysis_galbana.AAC.4